MVREGWVRGGGGAHRSRTPSFAPDFSVPSRRSWANPGQSGGLPGEKGSFIIQAALSHAPKASSRFTLGIFKCHAKLGNGILWDAPIGSIKNDADSVTPNPYRTQRGEKFIALLEISFEKVF